MYAYLKNKSKIIINDILDYFLNIFKVIKNQSYLHE